jgi:hypothetical protein
MTFPGSLQMGASKRTANEESFSSQRAEQVVPATTLPSKKIS